MRAPARIPSRSLLLALLLAGWAGPAHALTVRFAVEDLPDAPASPDRWRYVYTIDEFPYDAGWGFTVYFDPLRYESIETPLPAVGPDWTAVEVQPDPGSFDGFYDAEASVDAPSVATSFAVAFVWLGPGVPGAQPFELRDPSYLAIETGITVPEPLGPAPPALVLGVLGVAQRRLRRSRA